jgi:uncharacterized lipoprotein YmbA
MQERKKELDREINREIQAVKRQAEQAEQEEEARMKRNPQEMWHEILCKHLRNIIIQSVSRSQSSRDTCPNSDSAIQSFVRPLHRDSA